MTPPDDLARTERRILLIGMMGTGKTTIGEAIAGRTGWRYLDNDELLQRASGRSAPEVLEAEGERGLRAAESAALTEALEAEPPLVAGIAAGVVLDDGDLARLRNGGFVVWLRARMETLAERVGSGEGRSWLGDDPLAALARLYERRAERYAAAAALIVDVDDVTPDEVARTILNHLSSPNEEKSFSSQH